ncbi:hypothetical protein CAP36_14670 [Chitinophagaceae bacterium IBVUCB2]|nr:hypothetical protein CAP36_14670 [Chitinophagaceae bacterium IBVUCB2]
MTPLIIGISSGIFLIILFEVLKRYDKQIVYGLILTGIGFIYIGFTWTDLSSLIINSTQAVFFLALAYYGIKKNMNLLALGYFLHGSWDIAYDILGQPDLVPPHYDVFCLSIDFTIGIYLLFIARSIKLKLNKSNV